MRRAVRVTPIANSPSRMPARVVTTPAGVSRRSTSRSPLEKPDSTVPGVCAAAVSATLPVMASAGCVRPMDNIRTVTSERPGRPALTRAIPKIALVSAGRPGRSDVTVRMLSMGRTHPALAITGSVALTAAAHTPGTVLSDFTTGEREVLRLDTPAGVVTTRAGTRDGLLAIGVTRTARRIGDATLALPDDEPPATQPTTQAASSAA